MKTFQKLALNAIIYILSKTKSCISSYNGFDSWIKEEASKEQRFALFFYG